MERVYKRLKYVLAIGAIVAAAGFSLAASRPDFALGRNIQILFNMFREVSKNGLAGKIWQYFTVVPEFRSTGIKNGKRAFEWCCIVRAVCSTDVMTATAAEIPHEVMVHITDRITHEVAGINRVLYDFTPKPTGTVEFE